MTSASPRAERSRRDPAVDGRSPTNRSRLRQIVLTLFGLALLVGFAPPAGALPAEPSAPLEARVRALEDARDALYAIAGTTVVGTILTLIAGWFRLVKKADQLARKQVDKIVESHPGAVERLVQAHETEARLRREAKVAIVSDVLELQALLREHGFRELKTLAPAQATGEELESFAAVVLDLTTGVSQAAAADLIEGQPRDVFLAYSTAPQRLELPPGRATFANSPITLYARLMELLKFREARRVSS